MSGSLDAHKQHPNCFGTSFLNTWQLML